MMLKMTTIENWQIGEEVNIETDLIGKYVEKMLRAWQTNEEEPQEESHVDMGFLQKHGFLD